MWSSGSIVDLITAGWISDQARNDGNKMHVEGVFALKKVQAGDEWNTGKGKTFNVDRAGATTTEHRHRHSKRDADVQRRKNKRDPPETTPDG